MLHHGVNQVTVENTQRGLQWKKSLNRAVQPVEDRPRCGVAPAGSECCGVEGDDDGEAYTASMWGVEVSHDSDDVAGTETFQSVEGNTCRTAMRGSDALPGSRAKSRIPCHGELGLVQDRGMSPSVSRGASRPEGAWSGKAVYCVE